MSYKLWGFWGARSESTHQCAARLANMLVTLSAVHPAFTKWNQQGSSVAEAQAAFCEMPPKNDELTEIFDQGRHYTDIGDKPMSQLGYDVSAWNGREDGYALHFHINAGAYARRRDTNSVFFQLPRLRDSTQDLVNATTLKRVLLAVALPWEVDWAVIETWDYRGKRLDSEERPLHPWAGWITYLSQRYARNITLPSTAIVERIADGGLVMLATDQPFTVANPAHVAALDAMQASLAPVQWSIAEGPRR